MFSDMYSMCCNCSNCYKQYGQYWCRFWGGVTDADSSCQYHNRDKSEVEEEEKVRIWKDPALEEWGL